MRKQLVAFPKTTTSHLLVGSPWSRFFSKQLSPKEGSVELHFRYGIGNQHSQGFSTALSRQEQKAVMNGGRASLRIFMDFDSTLTRKDTCTLIPQLAVAKQSSNIELLQNWKNISGAFMEKYEKALHDGHKLNNFSQFLDGLDRAELFGVTGVEEKLVLKGISKDDLKSLIFKFNSELAVNCESIFNLICNGSASTSENCKNSRIELCILSSNWSLDVIESFLFEKVQPLVNKTLRIWPINRLSSNDDPLWSAEHSFFPNIYIYSNDLRFDDNNLTDGKFLTKQCVTSMDKLMSLRHHLFLSRDTSRSVYIGDSFNDMRCILETNGIFYFPPDRQHNVLDYCSKFGIQMKTLQENQFRISHHTPTIAHDWKEITQAIENEIC
ncbi:hypothetical protein C9374_001783 [Naegleria lovaniensis]|uniref:Uncharacterized protein n=1 Tax=Naegleria lovaniensis TaxID=51637 RepID=A0AA88GS97_NAELO|nr:uncharacterized protein C9374_001783 [Naegleria lovaniensis]KAG2387451.1 hypothetical protein C9374_001783 [Naegleria lovaniensis]